MALMKMKELKGKKKKKLMLMEEYNLPLIENILLMVYFIAYM